MRKVMLIALSLVLVVGLVGTPVASQPQGAADDVGTEECIPAPNEASSVELEPDCSTPCSYCQPCPECWNPPGSGPY